MDLLEYAAMDLDRSHTVDEYVSWNCDGQDPLSKEREALRDAPTTAVHMPTLSLGVTYLLSQVLVCHGFTQTRQWRTKERAIALNNNPAKLSSFGGSLLPAFRVRVS